MATQSAQKHLPPSTEIPDRLYFRIGDVAKICGVEPYVLRFWETQFPALKPNKGGTGQRLYRRREVELAVRIKQLVHEQGYTLAGARQALESTARQRTTPAVKQAVTTKGTLPNQNPGAGIDPAPVTNQGSLALTEDQAQQRLEAAAAAIGRARAELRDLARQLAAQEPTVNRRRSRLATFKTVPEPLFPTQ